jgi:transposase
MKKDGRSNSREALENYRFQALKLRKKGWKVTDIAEAFGLHVKSVSRWFVKVSKYGEKSLKSTKAKGKKPKISFEEWKQIISWMKEDATNYGFETPLWTSKRIKSLIKMKLNKTIHISRICEWLKRLKISPQIPNRQAKQKDEKLADEWLKEEWPKIKAIVRRQQAILYFQDEAGISLTPVLGRTWAPRGKTPTIKVTGKRGGFCVSSAISPGGRMVFRIEKKKINAQAHIDFLSKIVLQHPNRKIIIISDNAPAHKAKLVKEFEISNKKRMTIFHIPSYSPDLNPDEHVWAYLKAHKLVAHQAQNTEELKDLTRKKMQNIQRSPNLIKSFFKQNKVTKS